MRSRRTSLPQPSVSALGKLGRIGWGILLDAVVIAGLISLAESTGRSMTADWQAFLVGTSLGLLGGMFLLSRPGDIVGGAIKSLFGRLRKLGKRVFALQLGFDFRPSTRESRFLLIPFGAGIFVAAFLSVAVLGPGLPGLLAGLRVVSGTLMMAVFAAYWAALTATILVMALTGWSIVETRAREKQLAANRRHGGMPRPDWWRASLWPAGSLLVVLLVYLMGGGATLAWTLVVLSALHIALALLPRGKTSPGILVRHKGGGGLRRSGMFGAEHALLAAMCLWGLVLFIPAHGAASAIPGLLHEVVPASPFSLAGSRVLATIAAIALLAAACPVSFFSLRVNWRWLRENPSSPRTRTLAGPRNALPAQLPPTWRKRGATRAPMRHRADLFYAPSGGVSTAKRAPLFKRDLEAEPAANRAFLLDHVDWITKRRAFYRGLRKLLKIASSIEFHSGGGFLLAPHHFFIEGLHRDDPSGEDQESRIIGPPFRRLWGVRVRQYLFEMFSTLEIDLVYFEDGVKWPRLRDVFNQVFEHYRRSDDPEPLMEKHFQFLPGLRVFIEDMSPDSLPEKREGYRETHFENLSRARILIVYKDDGEDEEKARGPSPDVRVPLSLFG